MTNYLIKGSGFDQSHYIFELTVGKERTTYEIKATNDLNAEWNLKACKPVSLVDTGNGVIIQYDKKKIFLDYGELDDLDTLLRIYRKEPKNHLNEPIKIFSTDDVQGL